MVVLRTLERQVPRVLRQQGGGGGGGGGGRCAAPAAPGADDAGGGRGRGKGPVGTVVAPGRYRAVLGRMVGTTVTPLGAIQSFQVVQIPQ